MNSFIISVLGEIITVSPFNGSNFSLVELQNAVKGLIDVVPIKRNVGPLIFNEFDKEGFVIELTDEYVMVINSLGKFETPDINHIATVLATTSDRYLILDYIFISVFRRAFAGPFSESFRIIAGAGKPGLSGDFDNRHVGSFK